MNKKETKKKHTIENKQIEVMEIKLSGRDQEKHVSVKLNCSLIADTYNNIYFNKTTVYVMIKAIVF